MTPPIRALVAAAVLVAMCPATVLALSASKLSVHTSMGPNTQKILDQAHPRVVKLLDSFGAAAAIQAANPGIAIIGRIYLNSQPMSGDPNATAQAWWNQVSSTILQYPAVTYWEGYNEPAVPDVQTMQWYNAFEAARVQLLAAHGRKAAIGCFSVGVPDITNPPVVNAFLPAIKLAKAAGGVLAVHEYAAPFLNATFAGSVATGSGWLTGRYRKLYSGFLQPAGLGDTPLVITEHGIDGGTCGVSGTCPKVAGSGWKNFCGFWSQSSPLDCPTAYLRQLAWFDSVMRADSYVLGATIFSLEISGWDDFDIAPLTDSLIAYMNSVAQ